MIEEIRNPEHVERARLVVGIPSYNEADTIAHVVQMADAGLRRYYPDYPAVIVNADNCSPDGTRDVFLQVDTATPKIYVSTPQGMKGKGRNIRNLLEVGVELRAQAILMLDADLKSITPEWIEHLIEPLLEGYDFVVPIYLRHKYDGTITNHIAYPMLRTLYGLRVRQPIGGDFGISNRLARCYLVEKTWYDDVFEFGIDIWLTTVAIGRHFQVCQTFLGSAKAHRHKDPAKDLGPMFANVVGTIFQQMVDFEYLWKGISRSRPSIIYGFGLGQRTTVPEVHIHREGLFQSLQQGFQQYSEIWQKVLQADNWSAVNQFINQPCDQFSFASDLWARMIFDFATAYCAGSIPRRQLLSAFIPLYHARVLSFFNRTQQMTLAEAEEYLENINRVFEKQKPYLIQRWDEMLERKSILRNSHPISRGHKKRH